MRTTLRAILLLTIVLFWFTPVLAEDESSKPSPQEKQKIGSDQGLTLDAIGKGLKSATKNIEEEIPKIGPAIGNSFKKMTDKNPDNVAEDQRSENKRGKKTK